MKIINKPCMKETGIKEINKDKIYKTVSETNTNAESQALSMSQK